MISHPLRISEVLRIAPIMHGWKNVGVGAWERSGVLLRMKYSPSRKFQVVTYLNHPTQGRTMMVRHFLTAKEVIELLKNPRAHVGKGYQPHSPQRRLVRRLNEVAKNINL